MRQNFIILFLFLLLAISASAQETIFEEKTTIFKDEMSGGIGLHTNGFQATYRYSQYLTGFTKRVYEFEVANLKHPREIRTVNPFESNVRGYIFGKINSVFIVRPSIGFHKIFVPKQSIKGVSITYVFQLGPSLAFVKPVYLNIIENDAGSGTSITKKRYNPEVHSQNDIYGRASFLNGFNELNLYPGVFTKLGLQFDYSQERESIRSIEVGFKLDGYFRQIPIMAFTDNRAIYPNIYLAFYYGAKKIK